ncbi:MAG: hypothetical protein FWG50_07015 [Kiritimatiellaeota bacterium]|nr:hypothetical protein [Kiritimatiellota bacterium]
MKKVILVVAICFAAAAFAQDGKVPLFSVTRLQTQITAHHPDNIPYFGVPAGCRLTYLITGDNIVNVKKDSLYITKLQTKDGTDISKKSDGTPAYRLGGWHPRFFREDNEGKLLTFYVEVTPDTIDLEELPSLEGFITFFAASGKETETVTIEAGDTQAHTVGAYKVSLMEREHNPKFTICVEGPEEGLLEIDVTAGGQRLKSSSKGHQSKTPYQEAIYHYQLDEPPPPEALTVSLTLWKDLQQHTMPLHPVSRRRPPPNTLKDNPMAF